MAAVRIGLLLVGVAGVLIRPFRLPAWVVPVGCAGVVLAIGATSAAASSERTRSSSCGGSPARPSPRPSRLLHQPCATADTARRWREWLWLLATLVTTVLNLDASVVLLTPLYVRIRGRQVVTRSRSRSSRCSSPFSHHRRFRCRTSPTSSLRRGRARPAVDFLAHLAVPSIVATWIGWRCYRRAVAPDAAAMALPHGSKDEQSGLIAGGIVVAFVLVGFVVGPSIGVQPWAIALAADLVLVALVRHVPLGAIPWGTALVAGSLAVLAATAVGHRMEPGDRWRQHRCHSWATSV